MSTRLEAAIKQLTSEQLEGLTREAEALAAVNAAAARSGAAPGWKLDWAGALKDAGFASAKDAQRCALREWEEMVMRGLRQ